MPAAVTPVLPGIEKRFRDLVQLIKKNPANNTAVNEALGIEGAVRSCVLGAVGWVLVGTV